MGFVLYSGTAIALHLRHRVSVDFDPFTEKSLKREELGEVFPFRDYCSENPVEKFHERFWMIPRRGFLQ